MSEKKKNKNQKLEDQQEYLKDMEEWQEHQFSPGYYLGGNLPPYVKYRNGLFQKTCFILGVVSILVLFIIDIAVLATKTLNFKTIALLIIINIIVLIISYAQIRVSGKFRNHKEN